jgi:hypothetical protein
LTPVPFTIARPLMEELVAPSIVIDQTARGLFPDIQTMPYADSVTLALARAELPPDAPWMETLITRHTLAGPHVKTLGEGLLIDYRERSMKSGADWSRSTLKGQAALRALNGESIPGWTIRAGKAGVWTRLRNERDLPGKLYREVQLKSGTWREALMFEPRGVTGMLWWHLNFWRRDDF